MADADCFFARDVMSAWGLRRGDEQNTATFGRSGLKIFYFCELFYFCVPLGTQAVVFLR